MVFYDKDKQFISVTTSSTTTFTTPEKCEYIRFAIQSDTLPSWVQIEVGNTKTSNIEHQQEDYLLYIQQEMLEGDYFVKEADGWKEVHNYSKYEITGNETMLLMDNTVDETYLFRIDSKTFPLENYSLDYIMNYFTADTARTTTNTIGSYIFDSRLRIRVPASIAATTEEIKSWLQEKYNSGNPVYIYYKEESLTKLACTDEQSAVLEELSNLDLFDGTNNIITAEDIALLKLKYSLDVKTYVNNQLANVNAQILEIVGGN